MSLVILAIITVSVIIVYLLRQRVKSPGGRLGAFFLSTFSGIALFFATLHMLMYTIPHFLFSSKVIGTWEFVDKQHPYLQNERFSIGDGPTWEPTDPIVFHADGKLDSRDCKRCVSYTVVGPTRIALSRDGHGEGTLRFEREGKTLTIAGVPDSVLQAGG